MTNQDKMILEELLKIEKAEQKRKEKLIMLDQMKHQKIQKAPATEQADKLELMDEDARWELALR